MEKELDPLIIKATQSSLGKYVKRPPLTEKLLKKPPFRFLHDIVTSVLKTTGFFEGLFDEEELVSDNVKDRENKIIFLNKVITVVGLTSGKTLAVKPTKIIAGQEPDKTNELLQCLAQALDKNISSEEAVKQFKEGSKVPKAEEKRSKESLKQIKKSSDANKLTSKSSEKLTKNKKESGTRISNKNESEKANVSKTKKEKTNTDSPPKKSQSSKLISSKKLSIEKKKIDKSDSDEIEEKRSVAQINSSNKQITETENVSQPETVELTFNSETTFSEQTIQKSPDNSYVKADNVLNSSLSSQDLMESENINIDVHDTKDQNTEIILHEAKSLEQKNIIQVNDNIEDNIDNEQKEMPLNIKPSPMKSLPRKLDFNKSEDKNEPETTIIKSPTDVKAVVRPLSVRPSSSRPGAPRPRDKHDNIIIEAENILVGKVNIIAESSPNEEEEDASIVIVEQESNNVNTINEEHKQLLESSNEHGHLVQQILDSQKEFSQMAGKTEIEWQFGAQKARDALNKEIEQLRFDIQALSRVANPLGKVMDHIQEDVEVMRQELNQWTKTYEETSKELHKQKAANEESLFSLYAKVKQLGIDIQEKHDKINDLKIIIHKNSLRIDKLLANGTVQ